MKLLNAKWNFGVGCFAFEYKDVPATFTLGEWGDAVNKGLELLPTVDGVKVEVRRPEATWTRKPDASEVAITSAGALITEEFIPLAQGATIEFSVSIPQRLHKDYQIQRAVGERFQVSVQYGYHGPVAFVVCVDDNADAPECDGSEAVILVRKFLTDALDKSDSSIRMSITGPSPFHAKFAARPADMEDNFAWEETHRAGYAYVIIKYKDVGLFDPEDKWKLLKYSLLDEFAIYYRLIRMRDRRVANSVRVFNATEALIRDSTARGIRGSFGRIFGTSRDARELGMLALQAQLMSAADRTFAETSLDNLSHQTRILGIATEEMRAVANDTHEDAIDNALAMVNFLETSRSREFEVSIVAASTLLGGVSGAIAALIASA